MSNRVFATIVVATSWCVCSSPAAAQTPPPPGGVESMPFRVGALGLSPTLTITDIGVDSNIFNDAATPERDFTMTIVPKLDARMHAGRALLSFGNAAGFVYYQKHPDERSINYAGDGRVDLDFGRLQAFVAGGFADTRDRLNAEVDARASRTTAKGEAGARFTIAPRSALSFAVRRSILQFDPDAEFDGVSLSDNLNSRTDDLDGAVHFFVTPLTTVSLTTTVRHDRFDESPSRDADSVRVAPGVRFDPIAYVNGSLAIGYKRFDPANHALEPFRGLVADGALGFTIADRTHLDLTVKRDVQYSFEETEPYYLSTGARLTLTQHVAGPVDAQATAGRERFDYRGFGAPTARPAGAERGAGAPARDGDGGSGGAKPPGSGSIDRFSLAGAGLVYRARATVKLGINMEFARRTSDRPDREFRRTRVFGSFSYGL